MGQILAFDGSPGFPWGLTSHIFWQGFNPGVVACRGAPVVVLDPLAVLVVAGWLPTCYVSNLCPAHGPVSEYGSIGHRLRCWNAFGGCGQRLQCWNERRWFIFTMSLEMEKSTGNQGFFLVVFGVSSVILPIIHFWDVSVRQLHSFGIFWHAFSRVTMVSPPRSPHASPTSFGFEANLLQKAP